jgi:hypothetical protein
MKRILLALLLPGTMFVMSFSAGQTPDANLEQKLLAQRRLVIERPLHRQLELVDLKRLGHVIVRAHLHCLNRGFDRAVRSDQNHRRLPMMFPHMSEHVEPGHRLHFDVGDHDLRHDAVQLLDCFRREIEGGNLMALFPTESHNDGKSQRGEYFNFEKKKAVLRICLLGRILNLTANHRPTHPPVETNDLVEHRCRSCSPLDGFAVASARNRDQVSEIVGSNFAERIFLP